MIKNKELLEIIEQKKNEVSCENCKHCNLSAYHRGKWYCKNRSADEVQQDIEECFERRIQYCNHCPMCGQKLDWGEEE